MVLLAKQQPRVTNLQIQETFGVSRQTASRWLDELVSRGAAGAYWAGDALRAKRLTNDSNALGTPQKRSRPLRAFWHFQPPSCWPRNPVRSPTCS